MKCLLCGGSASSLPFKDSFRHYCLFLFLLLLFFTSLTIVASSLVLVTNQKSLRKTEKVRDSVMDIGEDALVTVGRVMKKMKQIQYLLLPYNKQITADLNTTLDNFRSDSRTIRRFVHTTWQIFQKAIHTTNIAHIVIVSVNLVTLIAALVLLLLRWRAGFITIIFCCWILTTLCWIMTGYDFSLNTFVDDACFAFEEFEQNPENSSLSSTLPCMHDADSAKLMTKVGYTIHKFISELNAKMSEIYGMLGIEKETQKVLGVIKICEPFTGPPNYTYIPDRCHPNAIPISELPKILARFTCGEKENEEECKRDDKFLPEATFNMTHAYSRSVQDFLDIYPDLQDLSNCSFVKNKISDTLLDQCKALKNSVRFLWASFFSLSIVMLVLVLAFVAHVFLCWDKSLSLCSRRTRLQHQAS